MNKLFSLLLFISFSKAIDIPIGPKFVQQNQHTAFFFVGESSLISDCSLAKEDLKCRFSFNDKNNRDEFFDVSYLSLPARTRPLLHDLQALYRQWENESISTDILGRLTLTRNDDLHALEQLIQELQTEPLQERVLYLRSDTRDAPAYFYSGTRARAIFEIFRKNLSNSTLKAPSEERNEKPSA